MPNRPTDFKTIVSKDGKIDPVGFSRLLENLNGVFSQVSDLQALVAKLQAGQSAAAAASGSSPVKQSQTQASTSPGAGTKSLYVANSAGAQAGMLVHYTNQSMQLADCRYRPATHYVAELESGTGRARLERIANGRAILYSTDGTSDSTTLYLYQNGLATDNASRLRTGGTGGMLAGVRYFQAIGDRIGAKNAGFVDAAVHIYPAQG